MDSIPGQALRPVLDYAPRLPPYWKWLRRSLIGLTMLVVICASPCAWFYSGWKREQDALAKLPGFYVRGTDSIGPSWLQKHMGRASFVLERVHALDGSFTRVTDLSPVVKFKRLQVLDLRYTPVVDLSALSRLTGLRELKLSATKVTDLSPLGRLTTLKRLDLAWTRVTGISHLAGMTGLQWLDLSGTCVTDLSPLTAVTTLRFLEVAWLAGAQGQSAQLNSALPQCEICWR
jgi:hypothetical protein